MKFPIAWHEDCLRNYRDSLKRDREALERQVAHVARRSEEVSAYEQQIAQAKAAGKDSFDRNKFGKVRS